MKDMTVVNVIPETDCPQLRDVMLAWFNKDEKECKLTLKALKLKNE
jgi:hypothetical protein